MCKLAGLTSTHLFTREDLAAFAAIFHVHSRVSAPDGFGVAHFNGSGVHVDRWHLTEDFCPGSMIAAKPSRAPAPLLIHARNATCAVQPENTHPMAWSGHALIHNGVVDRPGYATRHTSCDSEFLLQAFLEGGQEAISRSVSGSFAYLLLYPHGQMHVARDEVTPLFFARVEERECYVFGTDCGFLDDLPFPLSGRRLFPRLRYSVFSGAVEIASSPVTRGLGRPVEAARVI